MSKIDKLNVLGIRSFGIQGNGETIQFETPLTLIVGHNGSGKTTIIECLKYATTGKLPPNSQRGAFIHDPNLCGEKESLAQVKLQFKSMEGDSLTVSRRILLTVKKTTMTQKTLDSSLSMKKDGERRVISSKVALLDELMPTYLGVSEAVLDSVIFCHQDESMWPISEPANLKKKFDEIFEAGQYTKAIENIKKMRKVQNDKLAKYKLQEDHAKVMKDKGERSEKRSIALQTEIEKLGAQAAAVTAEMNEANAKSLQKHKEAEEYFKIVSRLESKQNTREERQKNMDELKLHLNELSDSDDSLQTSLEEFGERMASAQETLAQHAEQEEFLAEKIAECRKNHSTKLAKQGQFVSEKITYERRLNDRVKLVQDSASKHRIRGYEGNIEDYQIDEFVARIAKAVREKQREATRAEEEASEASKKAGEALQEIENRINSLKREKKFAMQSIETNDAKIKTLQRDMDSIQVDEGRKTILHSSCQELETRLKIANSDYEKAEWDSSLKNERGREDELDAEIDKLRAEQTRINKLAAQRGELEHVKKELKSRANGLETMTVTYGNRITAAIGTNWKPETLEGEFKSVVREKSSSIAEARSLRDGTAAELAHIHDKCKVLREDRDKKIAERNSCEKQVLDSMDLLTSIEDYESQLAELEDNRVTLKVDVENFGHLKNFWNSALKHVETKNKCHVCTHRFSGDQEKLQAIENIRKKMMANEQENLMNDLKEVEESLDDAHATRPRYETYKRLSGTEIPAVQEQLKQAEAKREEVVARLEKQDLTVEEAEANKTDLEALDKPISDIARYTKEISSYNKTLEGLSSQPEISSAMSTDEIGSQLKDYNEQMRAIKIKIDNLRDGRERAKGEIAELKLKLGDKKSELEKATHHLDRKSGLAQQIQGHKDSNVCLRETIGQADEDLAGLLPQADKAREEVEDVHRVGKDKVKRIGKDLSDLALTDSNLKRANEKIDDYLKAGGPNNLVECRREIQIIEDEIQQYEQKSSEVKKAIMDLKEQIAHGEESKRNITDNLKYRTNLKALESLNAEIAQLQSTNASEDYDLLSEEARAYGEKSQLLNANRSSLIGQIRGKDEALKEMLDEWESDFKDANANYRETHIKVETTKAAIEDLGKYGNALDQAIMKYHSLKMEEINRIAGELWQSTYQGTDVDTILIRSDSENTKNSRNFNYRVCMVKSDVEMDMRGRCSAGQRVLASIIIRLALAECFGVNCGIIALDEPTTNLDQDNIRSLAQSLHEIIRVRRVQKNFQLIVITHDEEFLKAMRCDSFCDNYWRISRNDSQKSIIRMQSIKEVLG